MDGVIVDSEPRHERAFHAVLREIGYAEKHGLRFADYVGRRDHELWIDFIAKNHPPHSLEELLALKRAHTIELLRTEQPIFDGLIPLVESLAAQVPLAVASGSEKPVVEAVLELRDLRRWFRVVVTGSDITRGKPEPDIFLKTGELLGVKPDDCWVVEDSKPGIAAARAAGMRVIAVTNTHPAEELRDATRIVGNCEEIGWLLLGEKLPSRKANNQGTK